MTNHMNAIFQQALSYDSYLRGRDLNRGVKKVPL